MWHRRSASTCRVRSKRGPTTRSFHLRGWSEPRYKKCISAVGIVSRCMEFPKQVDKCWARSLGDCSGKLSGEHYVSACLFPSGKAIVKGFPWCRDEAKTIGLSSLTRNILCRGHNSRLSELDTAMLNFFETLRESDRLTVLRTKLRRKTWNVRRFEINRRLLERWFLKTLINLNFGQDLRFGDTEEQPGVPPEELVRIAFGLSEFEGFAGMYTSVRPGESLGGPEGVSITTYTERESLVTAEFRVCGMRFILSLVQEEVHEFQESQLSHNAIDYVYRVPDSKWRMIRSHCIHIR